MARLEITSRDAERIARSFNDLIKPSGLLRIQRKAVNETGATIRKSARSLAPILYGTAAANLRVQGSAAAPGSDNPSYKLRLASGFPVSKLRASLRPVKRKGGRRTLAIRPPHQKTQRFGAIQRIGRAFRLLPAGALQERYLGDVSTRARRAFGSAADGGLPELAALRKRAEKTLPETVAQQIREHLSKRRRT